MTDSNRDEIDAQMDRLRQAYEEAKAAGDQAEMERLAKELVDAAGEQRVAKDFGDGVGHEHQPRSGPADFIQFVPPADSMAESGDAEAEYDAPAKSVGKGDDLELLEAARTEEEIVTAAVRKGGPAGDDILTYAGMKRRLEDLTVGGVVDESVLSLLTFSYNGEPHVWLPTAPIDELKLISNGLHDSDAEDIAKLCQCTKDGESDDCRVHMEPVEARITLCRFLDDGESRLVYGLEPGDEERKGREKLSERELSFAFRLMLMLRVQARDSGERRSVPVVPVGSMARVHEWWLALRREERPEHPVVPLGEALRRCKPPAEPNRWRRGIMGAPFGRRTKRRVDEWLPTLDTPSLPGEVRLPDIAFLPGLEPDRPEIATLLTLFDPGSDEKMLRGRPIVSHHQHVFVEGLLSAPIEGRSGLQDYAVPIGEIAGEWLGWSQRHYKANHRDYGVTLRQSIKEINKLIVPIDDSGFYYPLLVQGVSGFEWKDLVVFQAHFPPGSDVGAAIDRKVLRILFKKSPLAYRGYLSLCFEWDRYGARRGKLVRPTLPEVRRSEEGYVLDAKGKILTGKGRVPVRSPYDERAIRTGARLPNPERIRYPVYGSDNLVRLCYPAYEAANPATRRKWRGRAWKAIQMIEKAGGCSIERIGTGKDKDSLPWRVMPPDWGV